jgi:hypothetical protein
MATGSPPTDPPTAAELLNDPVVLQALNQAWADSESGDPVRRHEEGGWIYLDTASGALSARRATPGEQNAIDLSKPPVVVGSVIVGKFHTHPNPTADGWDPGPSAGDQRVDARHGVPDLIRSDAGVFVSGPASRRGGLAGGPGYPP